MANFWRWLSGGGAAKQTTQVTLNYLIPGDDDEPLASCETFAAGVNHVGHCGKHRQDIITSCNRGEELFLIRMPNNPHDANAIVLYRSNGQDVGMLTREMAAEMAPRLDRGSPVSATISAIEPFETERGKELLGVRVKLVPHRLRK